MQTFPKDVQDKLGDPEKLISVAEAKEQIAERMTDMLRKHIEDCEKQMQAKAAMMAFQKREIVQRQRQQRLELVAAQTARQAEESRVRAKRFASGFRGLWDRLTGKHAKTRPQNEAETKACDQRDVAERDKQVFAQLDERKAFHQQAKQRKQALANKVTELHFDVTEYRDIQQKPIRAIDKIEHAREAQSPAQKLRGIDRDR